jgi:hypothetical protein
MLKKIAGMMGILVATAAFGVDMEAPEMSAPPLPGAGTNMPQLPEPQAEHAWLQKFVGEWEADIEMFKEPGQPPEKSTGTESVRPIGGFWILAEDKGVFMDKPFTGILTLGYNPERKKYVATWVDSMVSHLWTYDGTVDATGNLLTLEAEGPCPMKGGALAKFRETVEFQGDDHRVFTSAMQAEDGSWATMMVIHYHRK